MKTPPTPGDLNKNRLVVEQVIADVMKGVKPQQRSDVELIVERANLITKDVHDTFTRMHKLHVVPMAKNDAVEHIRELYKDRYLKWTQDELLTLVSIMQAVLAAESLHDQLI